MPEAPPDALWSSDQYQLIDFGGGRKLERFGTKVLDRACPAAIAKDFGDAASWLQADVRLGDSTTNQPEAPECDWRVSFEAVQFQLRITPFGHVGLFPEHAAQWQWLVARGSQFNLPAPSILNLFAYTGGASLVLASHGWQVTHVDAAAPTVEWARQNALNSGLKDAPIRWLVEDARRYVDRELKRGRRYDAILLDPPSYGHGPKGKAWQIERDLPALMEKCCELLQPTGVIVLTGHSDPVPFRPEDLIAMRQSCGHNHVAAEYSRVKLHDIRSRALDFGWCLRSCSDG